MIYLASDHGGYDIKEKVKQFLTKKGVTVKDLGPHARHPNDDYPDHVIPLAEQVAKVEGKGIIACRNGQGAAIAANKVPGIRAAVCWDRIVAESSRTDDDTNVLSLPAEYIAPAELEAIVMTWLETPFSLEARHVRRVNKIADYEREGRS